MRRRARGQGTGTEASEVDGERRARNMRAVYLRRRVVTAGVGIAIVLVVVAAVLSPFGSGQPAPEPARYNVNDPTRLPTLLPGEEHAIDVSSVQGSINWPLVAHDHVSVVYIKATQGATYVNPYFSEDWTGSAASGIKHGAYQFFSFCSSGATQAASFLSVVPHDGAALPAAVDLELSGNCAARPSVDALARQLDAFVTRVTAATGRRVILYVGRDFAELYVRAIRQVHPLWLRTAYYRPHNPTWVIWQLAYAGRVPGVRGLVDLDVARGIARAQR